MPTPRHPEDHLLYEKFLDETRDEDGVAHRDQAVKLLLAELLEDPERVAEYAEARAQKVADNFDQSHKPEIENGQMALDIDTYLVIGDNERVSVDDAKAHHTRQWLDIQNIQKARHDMAHGAKTMHGYRLLAVQEEHGCSMWQAEQILQGAEL